MLELSDREHGILISLNLVTFCYTRSQLAFPSA